MKLLIITFSILILALKSVLAEQCGRQNNGAKCPNNLCCSQYGWCGTTKDYCGAGCQSQCSSSSPGRGGGGGSGSGNNDISGLISRSVFEEFLKHRNDGACPGRGFYTYDAFVDAAKSFPGFCSVGNLDTRRREAAAFFGQTSHETTGGWSSAPDGPYSWGYCFLREQNQADYCSSNQWPCASGQKYYGRGPIQLTHNYNYGQAGRALGLDLINNPELVATDPLVSFKTAIWFWMSPQGNKPSCHNVITNQWTPSEADRSAGRASGYGVITNIINGGVECGHGQDGSVADRIGFYKRFCDIFGVSYGSNLDCYAQRPF